MWVIRVTLKQKEDTIIKFLEWLYNSGRVIAFPNDDSGGYFETSEQNEQLAKRFVEESSYRYTQLNS